MTQSSKVYLFRPDATKSASPVFVSDPPREVVFASFHNPRPRQSTADKLSFELGALYPITMQEDYGIKTLPQILKNAGGWVAVSAGVRQAIEALEPGVHGFTDEICVSYKDGRRSEHKYYGLAFGADLIGTINVERSPWYPNGVNPESSRWPKDWVPFYAGAPANTLAINQSVVAKHHLWRAADYGDAWFCSEELYAAFKTLKVRGLTFHEQKLIKE